MFGADGCINCRICEDVCSYRRDLCDGDPECVRWCLENVLGVAGTGH